MAQKIEIEIIAQINSLKDQVSKIENNFKSLAVSSNKTSKSISSDFGKIKSAANGSFSNITNGASKIRGAFSSIASSVFSLKGALAGLAGAFAFGLAVKAAREQEDAILKLNTALAQSGDFSKEQSKRFIDLATSLQSISGIGDEVILNQISLAKSLGVSNDQAEKLIKASIELSAVTGESLDTSVRQLQSTLTGMPGLLGRSVIGFKNLTAEQLKAGAGIDFILEKFNGTSKALTQTFGGATRLAQASFGDFLEVIGNAVVQNQAVIDGLNVLSVTIQQVTTDLGESNKGLNLVTSAVGALAKATEVLSPILKVLVTGFINSFNTIKLIFQSLVLAINFVGDQVFKVINKITSTINSLAGLNIFGKLGDGGKDFEKSLLNVQKTAADIVKTSQGIARPFDIITNNAKKFSAELDNNKKKYAEVSSAATKVNNQVNKGIKGLERTALSIQEIRKGMESFAQQAIKNPFEGALKGLALLKGDISKSSLFSQSDKDFIKQLSSGQLKELIKKNFAGAGIGAFQSIAQGAAGATSLISGAAGIGAASFGLPPEVGQAVGQAVQFFAQGADAVRQQVQAFAEQISDLPQQIIEGALAFIDELIVQIPRVIDKLVQSIPQIIKVLSEQLPKIGVQLAAQMPMVATQLAISLAAEAPNIALALIKAIPRAAGGAVGGVGSVFKRIGFAEGGQAFVKQVPGGFSNDSFPARLTSGELVVDRSTAFELKDFLKAQRSGQDNSSTPRESFSDTLMAAFSQPIVINIDGRQVARVMRNQVRQGFVL